MEIVRVIFDAILFGLLGIFLGFLIDLIFPEPDENEYTIFLLLSCICQIVVTVIIVYYIDLSYESIMGVDSDTYLAFTTFTVIFFLVQRQLFTRLEIVFKRIFGRSL